MFKLTVKGKYEAQLTSNMVNKIIGAIDPNEKSLDTDTEYHIERFHDIPRVMDGYIAPETEHIERILEYSKSFNCDDSVLIHCHAGISRSPAIAILICIQHGMSIEDAFDHVYSIRDCMSPNILIIALGDNILRLNGELTDYLSQWQFDKNVRYGAFAGQVDKNDTQVMKDILNMFK